MRYFCLSAFLLFLVACSTIDCPVQNKVAVNYAVKTIVGGVEVNDTLKDTLYVWSTRSDGDDTLIFNSGQLVLPACQLYPSRG